MVGPPAQPLSPDAGAFVDYESPSFAGASGPGAAGRSPVKKRVVKKSQSQNWQIPAVVVGVGLLLVVCLVVWATSQNDEADKQQKKDAEEAHKTQVEPEHVIPYHAPKPTTPGHAERPREISDLPAANVAAPAKRPHVAVAPEGTVADNESMMPTADNSKVAETPPGKESPEKSKPAPAPDSNQKKLPVPAEDQQEKAEAKIKEIYKKEFAAAKSSDGRLDLASKLSDAGVGMSDDPTARFVLLRLAFHEAAEAQSLGKAAEIIDKINELYEVDAHALKADAVNTALDALHPGAGTIALARDLAATAMTLAEAAAAADRFDVASRLGLLAKRPRQGSTTTSSSGKCSTAIRKSSG